MELMNHIFISVSGCGSIYFFFLCTISIRILCKQAINLQNNTDNSTPRFISFRTTGDCFKIFDKNEFEFWLNLCKYFLIFSNNEISTLFYPLMAIRTKFRVNDIRNLYNSENQNVRTLPTGFTNLNPINKLSRYYFPILFRFSWLLSHCLLFDANIMLDSLFGWVISPCFLFLSLKSEIGSMNKNLWLSFTIAPYCSCRCHVTKFPITVLRNF